MGTNKGGQGRIGGHNIPVIKCTGRSDASIYLLWSRICFVSLSMPPSKHIFSCIVLFRVLGEQADKLLMSRFPNPTAIGPSWRGKEQLTHGCFEIRRERSFIEIDSLLMACVYEGLPVKMGRCALWPDGTAVAVQVNNVSAVSGGYPNILATGGLHDLACVILHPWMVHCLA